MTQPDFTSPIAGRVEVREPCPFCPDRPMIARALMDDHVAQQHPEVQTVEVHAGVAPATDEPSPSRRAGLRDEIVNALGRIKTIPPVAHRQEQADRVLEVLYREWPWLRAEAEQAAAEPFPIWTVWREDQPAYGHFATEDTAKRASIDCWEEDEPACPDYSWRRDGPRWELVVGGEAGGVYVSRDLVYGGLPQPPRAAVLREAADRIDQTREPFPIAVQNGITWATAELRRMAVGVGAAAEPADETPWTTDGARIGRVLIWSWSDVGKDEFGRGYRAAQAEARDILTQPLATGPAAGRQMKQEQP